MSQIITHLLHIIQYQNQQIRFLVLFISKYIPLGQWAHDDTHSPKYQKFKTDELPIIQPFIKQDWQFLLVWFFRSCAELALSSSDISIRSMTEETASPV